MDTSRFAGCEIDMIFTITVKDGFVYLFVDRKMVWSGSMERWSFAIANAVVANILEAA